MRAARTRAAETQDLSRRRRRRRSIAWSRRRLTVSPPGHKDFAGTLFLATPDCRAAFRELSARGVEFTEEPNETPYGLDSGFRDPSGNSIRLTEVRDG